MKMKINPIGSYQSKNKSIELDYKQGTFSVLMERNYIWNKIINGLNFTELQSGKAFDIITYSIDLKSKQFLIRNFTISDVGWSTTPFVSVGYGPGGRGSGTVSGGAGIGSGGTSSSIGY